MSNFSLYYATAVDILCDLLIMALPLRLLWNLQINRQQKSALAAIFSLGFVVIVFAVVRVIETSASIHHVDPIWLALWSMIEASVGKQRPQLQLNKTSFDRFQNSCRRILPSLFPGLDPCESISVCLQPTESVQQSLPLTRFIKAYLAFKAHQARGNIVRK